MKTYPLAKEAYCLIHEGALALSQAQQNGMRIDVEYCEKKKLALTRKVKRATENFKETDLYKEWSKAYREKTNLNSPTQLEHLLYDIMRVPKASVTASGRGATDEEGLSAIDLPGLEILIQIRKWKKIRDTYLASFMREQVDGFLHPFFHLHTARTFRSSSERINFQNIPKRDKEAMELTRSAIFPRKGHRLLECDYSSVEVKISETYHHDPQMKKYIEDSTTDMHGDMAVQIFKLKKLDKSLPWHKHLRQAAKNGFVFPQFYGDFYKPCAENAGCKWGGLPKGEWTNGMGIEIGDGRHLSDHLIAQGIDSYDAFENHMKNIEKDFWGHRFRVYQHWKDTQWGTYLKTGYIDLKTGFRCAGVMRKNECLNFPIQGSAFHCLLWSFTRMTQIANEEGWDTRLIGQIHDSMVLDVHPDEFDYVKEVAHRVMCEELRNHWQWIDVPMEMEMEACPVDGSWNEKKDEPR